MQVRELSKELNITNKDLITFLKNDDYNVTSHMQKLTDDMVDKARAFFKNTEENKDNEIKTESDNQPTKKLEEYTPRKISPDEMIPCKSIVPWKLNELSVDKRTVYHWEYFGDIDYIKYSDLQSMRTKDIIRKPLIIIEDPDICYSWRRDLGDLYSRYAGIEYPEDFFELSDEDFQKILTDSPKILKEVIAITARVMINNENYPSLNKIILIDNILGTCLKEFI